MNQTQEILLHRNMPTDAEHLERTLSRFEGDKIGNGHLKWAFSEAAVLFLRGN